MIPTTARRGAASSWVPLLAKSRATASASAAAAASSSSLVGDRALLVAAEDADSAAAGSAGAGIGRTRRRIATGGAATAARATKTTTAAALPPTSSFSGKHYFFPGCSVPASPATAAARRSFHSTPSPRLSAAAPEEEKSGAGGAPPSQPPSAPEEDPELREGGRLALTPEQILKVDKIFHKILWLDLFESSMLNDVVNYRMKLNLTPSQKKALERQLEAFERGEVPGGGGGGAKEGEGEAEEAKEDKGPKLVDIKLVGFDAKSKIKVIKEVRSMAGLGLKEAKELVEGAPVVIRKDVKAGEEADEIVDKLRAVGAEVEVA